MSSLLLVIGFLLVVAVLVDFFGTTLVPRRLRFLAWFTSRCLWHGFVAGSRWLGRPRLLELAGPAIVVAIFAVWIFGSWTAWLIVFLSAPEAIVEDASGEPAGFWERAYFVGYTLSTLGIGDYRPGSDLWRMLAAVASFAGLTIVTLTIANLFSVVVALADTRALAAQLTSLGRTGTDILLRGWDGSASFDPLAQQMLRLPERLFLHGERAEASPVVNHFVNIDRRRAIAPAVAALDDAVSLMRTAVAAEARPHDLLLDQICQAIEAVVPPETRPAASPVPWADADVRARLAAAGIPLGPSVVPLQDEADRRRRDLVSGWLQDTGAKWGD